MSEAVRRARAPIALQLVALLIGSLIAAQAIILAIVLLAPPPKPAMYRLGEVAEALRGGALAPRFGRPLLREIAAAAPAMTDAIHPRDPPGAA